MKRKLLITITTTLLLSGCFLTVNAQHIAGSAGQKTDEYIRIIMSRKHIPGLSVAVLKNGKILKMQSYGFANIETHTPATSQTVYKLASLSKQFIAASILLLQQGGKIELDSPVNRYLDSLPAAWQHITIRNLLTHTSGLVRDAPDFDPFKARPFTEDIKAIYPLPLDFAPGTDWDYSNMNYYVLASVIGKLTGGDWSEWISKHIFEPSSMLQTRTVSVTDLVPNRANGYAITNAGWENAETWFALRPSGAFLSTITDLAKWERMLYTDNILTANSKKQMWTAMKLNSGETTHYGFGWFIDSVNSQLRVHHDGSVPGFRSDFERYPGDNLSVIVLANGDGAPAEHMAENIAVFFIPSLKPQAVPDKEPQITAIVKGFIEGLQEHSSIDTRILGGAFARNYKQADARGMAAPFKGRIYAITLTGRREKNGKRIYRYYLDYGYDYIDLIIIFDSGNKITGFGIN